MTLKRASAQDETGENFSALTRDEPPLDAHYLRTANSPSEPAEKKEDEKLSIFWRVFGGTVFSIVALVCVTLYNNLNNTIFELRSEVSKLTTELRSDVNRTKDDLRNELGRINESRGDFVKTSEFSTRMTTVWDGIKTIQTQNTLQGTEISANRSEVASLKDRFTQLNTAMETFRKEMATTMDTLRERQAASTDAIKKDVAQLDAVKEKLAALTLDVNRRMEELMAVRQQLDRNQAYDQERKEFRDKQHRAIEEALKDLQKGVQDCREKMARLEGAEGRPAKSSDKKSPEIPISR